MAHDSADIDKVELLEALRLQVADELQSITASQKTTHAGATHAESRSENDKDTRALESSYLARGLASRVEDMREAVAVLQQLRLRAFDADTPVAVSALVRLEDDHDTAHHFIAPVAGGQRLEMGGTIISVVTPKSPLGRALVGKCEGDELELQTPRGMRYWSIVSVR